MEAGLLFFAFVQRSTVRCLRKFPPAAPLGWLLLPRRGRPHLRQNVSETFWKHFLALQPSKSIKMAWFNFKNRREHLKKPPCGAFAKDGDLKSFKNLHLEAHVNRVSVLKSSALARIFADFAVKLRCNFFHSLTRRLMGGAFNGHPIHLGWITPRICNSWIEKSRGNPSDLN